MHARLSRPRAHPKGCVGRQTGAHGDGGHRPEAGAYKKKCPAMTYFLGPLGTNIIGAEGLTAVFGMGTGVSLPL